MNIEEAIDWIEEPIFTVNGQRILKRYRKVKIVGEGSYSKCWLVQTQNSESTYVVKIIPKKKLELLVKQKLVYEIRIHQQLSHPHVVHLDHWFEDEHFQYIFMEYCSQGNLQKQLQKSSRMSQKDIRRYVRQIVEAISYIHSKNILHRDLKLCNFYLDSDFNVKLGDFGFACQLSHASELKRETCGTPNYIAPQAVSGFGYSFSSDVWAVGVILYRLKFKLCPFEAKTVRHTLQRVKTCQYSFPKGQKISDQLKDLIQKLFVINYDDRLTLNQILTHSFFEQETFNPVRPKSQSKGSFALLRNIFSREKDTKEKQGRTSRLKESSNKVEKNNQVAKRSNSCETFKQIKEIFKSKSKQTLITNQNTENKTEQNSFITYNTPVTTGRERQSISGTMRSIAQTSYGMSAINKRLESTSRMNNFMGSYKQQLKIQAKMHQNSKQTPLNQQLGLIAKKFYLPSEVHFEKDVVIVTYRDSIKQLIYRGQAYLIHRKKEQLYEMSGKPFANPPKLLKYIIDNRVQIAECEPDEQQYGVNTLQKILLFTAHRWMVPKDGIILFFGTSGLFISKMINQQLFYIGSSSKNGDQIQEDGKVSMMYTKEGSSFKSAEGIVLSRIYQGWNANALKQLSKRQ